MVKFKLKFPPTGKFVYIPKELREILGRVNIAVPDSYALLVYPEGTAIDKVLIAIDLIKQTIIRERDMVLEKEKAGVE